MLIEKYRVVAVVAHNALFDYSATNATQRYITKSKYRYFFPYGTVFYDTLKMAQDTICKQKSYINYCFENGYVTKHKNPRPRATAEIIYRYITGQHDFSEAHTGLEDVLIEAKIFAHCMRQHKKMRKNLF
jgi:DNA polymerase III epsilon subunit-like protein